jgi:hypothetical protein
LDSITVEDTNITISSSDVSLALFIVSTDFFIFFNYFSPIISDFLKKETLSMTGNSLSYNILLVVVPTPNIQV